MGFDDEQDELNQAEPGPELDALAQAVIGAAIEVHRTLGPGLDEAMYEKALCIELELRKIPFAKQVIVEVQYKGHVIGERRLDLLVAGQLIVELKAVDSVAPLHKAQALTYEKITRLRLGLLINFNSALLKEGIRRIINPYA